MAASEPTMEPLDAPAGLAWLSSAILALLPCVNPPRHTCSQLGSFSLQTQTKMPYRDQPGGTLSEGGSAVGCKKLSGPCFTLSV